MIECFPPVYDESCKILILGSMPSVKSLEASFYYMHPQNRFWKIMEKILETEIPPTPEDRAKLLLLRGVGLWDVLYSCDREGSLDSAIKNPVPNDILGLKNIENIPIFVNGGAAERYFKRFFPTLTATRLPSTSPANAAHFDEKTWLKLRDYLR